MLRARRYPQSQRMRFRAITQFSVIAVMLIVVVTAGFFPVHVVSEPATPRLQVTRFSLPGLAAAVPAAGAAELTTSAVPLTVVVPPVTEDAVLSARNRTEGVQAFMAEQQGASSLAADVGETAGANERIAIFFEYQVQPGDSVSAIAERFGVDPRYIEWNNVDVLTDVNTLTVGTNLQIPSVEGIIHSVRFGETVSEIAQRYDADARDIVEFHANGFNGDPNNLQDGSLILVPGGRIVPLAPALRPAPPSEPVESPDSDTPAPAAPDGGSGGWVWPGQGMLTSTFGPMHPLGVDIAMPAGSPLVAAAEGQVVFAGGNPCCSYGYHIIIDHGNGYETLYAHLNDFAVANGQWVGAGEIIGWSGNTGRSTGPHLHFEVKRNGQHQDPMQYLP